MGSKLSKAKSSSKGHPDLLQREGGKQKKGRYTFSFSYDTTWEFTQKLCNSFEDMAPEEDLENLVRSKRTKDDIIGYAEFWLSLQPEEQQEKLKKDILAGIFEAGRESDEPYSFTFQSSTLIVREESELPNYTA